jgi:radical SAM/Cys-rich protein
MKMEAFPIENEFNDTLDRHGLPLARGETRTLQVNVGYRCDLACRHCHLAAGPTRGEMMTRATMQAVIAYARRGSFLVADVTGGAPELAPDLDYLLTGLAGEVPRVMLRTNLTALDDDRRTQLIDLCRALRVILIASFPAVTASQLEAQRGAGVWCRSVERLRQLNELGYGMPGSDLELHLAANPAGAFLPQGQTAAERQFKRVLAQRLGLSFNHLFIFANMPLGRFKTWLEQSGNAQDYMGKLTTAFNPQAVDGLMCRSLVSVAWDGVLYDCDFNQAADLPLGGVRRHINEMDGPPEAGSAIATGRHCFACTAGAGFTCGGEIAA